MSNDSKTFVAISKMVAEQINDLVEAIPEALIGPVYEALGDRFAAWEEAQENLKFARAAEALGIPVEELRARMLTPQIVPANKSGKKAKGEIKRPRRDPVSEEDLQAIIGRAKAHLEALPVGQTVSFHGLLEALQIETLLPVAQQATFREAIAGYHSSQHGGAAKGPAAGYVSGKQPAKAVHPKNARPAKSEPRIAAVQPE